MFNSVSVIIPAHNEADSLPQLLMELGQVLDQLSCQAEILVIDDGSTDETFSLLTHWATRDSRVRCFRLERNCGQSAAFDAGFRLARGDALVLIDADGQNPPAEIPRLLAALEFSDMVCGWRLGRKDHWTKYLASKFANTLRRWVLQDGIHDSGCSLKAMRREVVHRLKLFHGMHRFLPALVQMEGFRVREIRVAHRARQAGTSHYGIFNRTFGPLCDLLAVYWMKHRCRNWRIRSDGPFSPSSAILTTVSTVVENSKLTESVSPLSAKDRLAVTSR